MFLKTWSVCRFLRMRNYGIVQRLRPYSTQKQTHYEVLGVSENATPAEIQEAFLEKSKKYHPDMNKDDPKAKEKFIEVSDAYGVLSKDDSRNDYDDMLDEEYMKSREPFKEHEFYGNYGSNVEERMKAEREKWKRYYQSGKNQWQFEAENEQWEGKRQYEHDGITKTPLTSLQIRFLVAFLIIMALTINFGGLYSTTKLKAKREAEKAAVKNALQDLEEQRKADLEQSRSSPQWK